MGTRHTRLKSAQIEQKMIDRAYVGEYFDMWMAHETDVPLRGAFPNEWMGIGEDDLD